LRPRSLRRSCQYVRQRRDDLHDNGRPIRSPVEFLEVEILALLDEHPCHSGYMMPAPVARLALITSPVISSLFVDSFVPYRRRHFRIAVWMTPCSYRSPLGIRIQSFPCPNPQYHGRALNPSPLWNCGAGWATIIGTARFTTDRSMAG
jgi:hypothetical protein